MSDKKPQFKKITSPRGEALYPKLKTPDTYQGKEIGYTIQTKFSHEDTIKLQELLEKELKAAKASPDFKGKKWMKEPNLGYREEENGDIIFKFKTKHEIVTKAGDIIKRTVPIFDSKGTPIDVHIGNGSIVRIAFTAVPYHNSSTNNGLTLRLEAVQVIELVEYNGTSQDASVYGFEEEEGYSFEDMSASVIPTPDDEDF